MSNVYVPPITLKDLMRRASKSQIASARSKTIDYLVNCKLAELEPEDAETVMREALQIAMMDQEPRGEYEPLYERHDYRAHYVNIDSLDGRDAGFKAQGD